VRNIAVNQSEHRLHRDVVAYSQQAYAQLGNVAWAGSGGLLFRGQLTVRWAVTGDIAGWVRRAAAYGFGE